MNIVRWNPYREVTDMIRTMNRLMDDDMPKPYSREKGCWAPAVDIEEDEKQVVLVLWPDDLQVAVGGVANARRVL